MHCLKRVTTAALAPALVLSFALAGCVAPSSTQGTSSDTASADSSSQTGDTTSSQTSSSVVNVEVKNETGHDVSSLAFRPAGASEYETTHTFEGFEIKNGASTTISFMPVLTSGKPAEAYDILVKTTDGAVMEMPNVALASLAELTLKFEGSTGYVEYVDSDSGEVVNNKEESEELIQQNTEDIETYDKQNQLG